jgi:hypothetical protein
VRILPVIFFSEVTWFIVSLSQWGIIIATLLTKKTKGSEEPFDYDLKQVQVLSN